MSRSLYTRGFVEVPRFLWHGGYYDGPLSGVCLYQDKKCWFRCLNEEDEKYTDEDGDDDYILHRIFEIVELSEFQLEHLELWHSLFAVLVGEHADYDENNKRDLMGSKRGSQETTDLFYKMRDKYWVDLDLSDNSVLAKFSR